MEILNTIQKNPFSLLDLICDNLHSYSKAG